MDKTLQQMSVEEMVDNCEEIADYFESVDLSQYPVYPAADYWLMCAAQRAAATGNPDHHRIRALVADARGAGSSWGRIGELLDMTAEAAEAKFG